MYFIRYFIIFNLAEIKGEFHSFLNMFVLESESWVFSQVNSGLTCRSRKNTNGDIFQTFAVV